MKAADLMPESPAEQTLLQGRAERLARKESVSGPSEEKRCYLQFRLHDGALYGIEQALLDEVIYVQRLTALEWLPDFVGGVIGWRGKILTVLDANYLCCRKVSTIGEESRVIVVTHENRSMGLLVGELCNFDDYVRGDLKTCPQNPAAFNDGYFAGLINSSVVLLDIEAMFADSALIIDGFLG